MKDLLSGVLPSGWNSVTDLERVGETNYLYGGLNIVYGIDGTGKSYQVAASFGLEDVIYLDTDGSNGNVFVQHCLEHNVHYIKHDTIQAIQDKGSLLLKSIKLIEKVIVHNRVRDKEFRPVFVLDSLTSLADGQEINNAEKISPLLYELNNHASTYNYCLVLIDHATEQYDKGHKVGFKLEGNASAKRRTSVTVNRYEPTDTRNPQFGGVFLCERARGNKDGLSKGDEFLVSKMNSSKAIEWIKARNPTWLTEGMTRSQMTTKTKNLKDRWVRQYIDTIFNKVLLDKVTTYTPI